MTNRNTFADFTEKERATITNIHKREFKDMTPDEVALYAEWISVKTKIETEASETVKAMREQIEADIETHQATEKATREAMEAMRDLAIARLEAVKRG